MNKTEIQERIKQDEYEGEKIICNFRIVVALIFIISVPLMSILYNMNGKEYFPFRAYICCTINIIFALFIYFYLRTRKKVPVYYKYICVILDMLIHSASIWIGCTYPSIAPAISFLSTWALFFLVLIMAGAFRYSVSCAYFSGIFGGLCYFAVVLINVKNLDLPYFFMYENQIINVSFPIYNELFRVFTMMATGFITGIACKCHLKLFNSLIETQAVSEKTALKTVEQTRIMADTIKKSTDDIFLSSKDIFTTANNQAASVQEIESTIKENASIAFNIAEKTSSVASISSVTENNIIHGFSILERNVKQLEDITKTNDSVISGIIILGGKITKISDIVKNINIITDQTKVIAFNAALEAAGAEEKGRRFAVVASEVNRLADDIAALTMQIKANTDDIQSSSASLIISSEESADKIKEGNNLIKELENIFKDIKNGAEITANQAQTITISTQKQLKSSEQINTAIADISKGLTNFIISIKAAASSAGELMKKTSKLGDLLTDTEEKKNGD